MEEPKKYKIETISDLTEIINRDNFENVMKDIVSALGAFIDVKDKYPSMKMPSVTWIDDGKHDITATISKEP